MLGLCVSVFWMCTCASPFHPDLQWWGGGGEEGRRRRGGSPSSSASFLSQSVTQIRSTVANTLPRAQNFLFPFQPSISPCVSMFSRQCLLPLYISLSSSLCRCLSHTLIDANRGKNALRLHLQFFIHVNRAVHATIVLGSMFQSHATLFLYQLQCHTHTHHLQHPHIKLILTEYAMTASAALEEAHGSVRTLPRIKAALEHDHFPPLCRCVMTAYVMRKTWIRMVCLS